MSQSADDFQAFMDKLKASQASGDFPRIEDSLTPVSDSAKEQLLAGNVAGGHSLGTMSGSLDPVDVPPLNGPARIPSWEQPQQSPQSGPGGMPAPLGQALIGAAQPSSKSPLDMEEDDALEHLADGPSRSGVKPPSGPGAALGSTITASSPQNKSWDDMKALFDPEAMAKAQDQARQNRMGTGIFQALASGAATATNTKFNPDQWKQINDQANSPVSDLQEKQKSQQDGLKALDAIIDSQSKQSAHDSTTPAARASQSLAYQLAAGAGLKIPPGSLDKMGTADIDGLKKEILNAYDVHVRGQQVQATKEQTRALQTQKIGRDLFDRQAATQTRGSVKNAWDALRQVDNAQSMLDEHPDLNSMTGPEVGLFISEVSKLAKSGAPTEAEQRELRPDTYRSEFQTALSKLTNSPTKAELGDFLKVYQPYVQALKQNAQYRIGESAHANLTSRKNAADADSVQSFKDEYAPYLQAYEKGSGGSANAPQVIPARQDVEAEMRKRGLLK